MRWPSASLMLACLHARMSTCKAGAPRLPPCRPARSPSRFSPRPPRDGTRRDPQHGAGRRPAHNPARAASLRSEEHTSELQSLMRISYAVFCLKKKISTKFKNLDNTETPTSIIYYQNIQHYNHNHISHDLN